VKRFWVFLYAAVFVFSVTYMAMLFLIGQPCASIWTMAIIILSAYMLNKELKIFKWKGFKRNKRQDIGKPRRKARSGKNGKKGKTRRKG
jgi:hypothetical protein